MKWFNNPKWKELSRTIVCPFFKFFTSISSSSSQKLVWRLGYWNFILLQIRWIKSAWSLVMRSIWILHHTTIGANDPLPIRCKLMQSIESNRVRLCGAFAMNFSYGMKPKDRFRFRLPLCMSTSYAIATTNCFSFDLRELPSFN